MRSIAFALALLLARAAAAQCQMHAGKPPESKPVLLDGLGSLHHPVTASKEAQRWFDQGLRLIYAFNHDEAVRSFQEALRLDPSCAMCAWGIAVALGPNINLPIDSDREKQALAAVAQAQALASKATPAERDDIEALGQRYGAPGQDRAARDRAYADAMHAVAQKHPQDADAQTLYDATKSEIREYGMKRELMMADMPGSGDRGDALGVLDIERRSHELLVQSFHLFDETQLVIKTQAIIEVSKNTD